MSDNIIIIGSSTGGPKILNDMFISLPALNAAIIIVQHVPVLFDKAIADRLDELSRFNVKLAEHGDILKSGTAYVAQAKRHLKLKLNSRIEIVEEAKVNCCCPSVDVTMMSLEKNRSGKIIGVILTGLGRDGADGISHIKSIGGTTYAQDEETCTIFGMPKAAIDTGKVDHIFSPDVICENLIRAVGERKFKII
jgi:two-component system chemotaxis response regulator CheB